MQEIKLPSGAILKITQPTFTEAKELYQAVLEELRTLEILNVTELDFNFFKNLFCMGFSSKKVERCLEICLKRCLYNDMKFDSDTFEPEEARGDHLTVMSEVAFSVLHPFFKNLTQLFQNLTDKISKLQS